jgi:tetratricopeptide (TPR) repeat protein
MGKRASTGRRSTRRESIASSRTYDFRMLACALALGLLTLAAYSNSFAADFVADSAVLVKQDPRIRAASSENVDNILHHTYWWPAYESDLYRPVTTLSFLFNYSTLGNGDRPAGYHVLNFILHWLNAVLVLTIVRRLSGSAAPAMIAASLFAVHPVNAEAVTYIAGRADLLATLSVLLGGWCYLRSTTVGGWRRGVWLAGLAANAFWGVFAKENAVMIVAFVLLYDWLWRWPALTAPSVAARVREAARQFGAGYLALVPALLTLWLMRRQLPPASPVFAQIFVDNPIIGAESWFQARMTAIKVLGHYFALLVYPAALSNDYSYNQIPLFGAASSGWDNALAWLSLGAIVSLIALAILLRRRIPLFAWGIGFVLLMLLPTSNLVITIGSIMAERFLYLPSVGFCAVAGMALWWLGQRRFAVAVAVSALVVFALGARTYARNIDWQNERSLWASTLAASPGSFKAYKGSATAIWANGVGTGEPELDAAIAMAERGVAILERTPLSNAQKDGALYVDLGQYYRLKGESLSSRGKPDEGWPYFQKSAGTLVKAREVDRWVNDAARKSSRERGQADRDIPDAGNFNLYVQLAAVSLDLHEWAGAEAAARYAMRLQPLDHSGYRLAAMARFNQGQLEDAAALFAAIVLFQPRNADARAGLMAVCERLGLQPPPIVESASGTMLDERNPIGRRLIDKGAGIVVQQLVDARQLDTAVAYHRDFVTRLHVPVSELPSVPSR